MRGILRLRSVFYKGDRKRRCGEHKIEGVACSGLNIWLIRFGIFASITTRLFAMLAAYFDDSGKDRDPHALTVAGAISSNKKWLALECEWNQILLDHGVKIFHMADFAASAGEFSGWDKSKRAPFISSLSDCISRKIKFGLGFTIELEGWRKVSQEFMLAQNGLSPYVLAAMMCVVAVQKWARVKKTNLSIDYVFEAGTKGNGILKKMLAARKPGVCADFKPKAMAQLQVADLIAWKNRRIIHDLVSKPFEMTKAEYNSSLSSIRTIATDFRVVDYEGLREFCVQSSIPRRIK